jgi:hypothetical protein
MRFTWAGFMVLMAYLVDLVEWGVILLDPAYFDQHFATNSPLVTAVIAAVVCLALAVFARLRQLWVYALVVLTIFSHLVLDHSLIRTALADAYRPLSQGGHPSLPQSAWAEVWLYGLLLLCVGLLHASRRQECPPRGRATAKALVAAAILAAITRVAWLWMPVYLLGAAHCGLIFRRKLKPPILWNLVPPIPVMLLLAVELWANHLYDRAMALNAAGLYPAAARMFQRVLAVPTRSQNLGAYIYLSECLRREGDLAGAEAALRKALRVTDQPWWAKAKLARLYAHSSGRETVYFRPDRARELLQQVIDGRAPAQAKDYAGHLLKALRERGQVE